MESWVGCSRLPIFPCIYMSLFFGFIVCPFLIPTIFVFSFFWTTTGCSSFFWLNLPNTFGHFSFLLSFLPDFFWRYLDQAYSILITASFYKLNFIRSKKSKWCYRWITFWISKCSCLTLNPLMYFWIIVAASLFQFLTVIFIVLTHLLAFQLL